MCKKVILVQVDSILAYPPTVSLINELSSLGRNVTVLTTIVLTTCRDTMQKMTAHCQPLANILTMPTCLPPTVFQKIHTNTLATTTVTSVLRQTV